MAVKLLRRASTSLSNSPSKFRIREYSWVLSENAWFIVEEDFYEIMDESNSIGDVINILSISGHRHVPIRLKDGGFGLVTIRQILRFIHDTVEQVEKKETQTK